MNTFLWNLELAALSNLDRLHRLVSRALGDILNLVHNLVALENLAEDNVTSIEPASDDCGDEELGAVGVFSGVGHAEQSFAGVLELEVLIWELVAIDRFAACAISGREVSSLDHEGLDDTVES